jgi:hypothetical protein
MAYLASLPLPAGLSFWCLAPVEKPRPGVRWNLTENIWCVDEQGQFVHLTVDLHPDQVPITT